MIDFLIINRAQVLLFLLAVPSSVSAFSIASPRCLTRATRRASSRMTAMAAESEMEQLRFMTSEQVREVIIWQHLELLSVYYAIVEDPDVRRWDGHMPQKNFNPTYNAALSCQL